MFFNLNGLSSHSFFSFFVLWIKMGSYGILYQKFIKKIFNCSAFIQFFVKILNFLSFKKFQKIENFFRQECQNKGFKRMLIPNMLPKH